MNSQYLKKLNLPDAPGVYFFKKGPKILYIGRATSLRDRVRSYFGNDLIATRGPLLVDMITEATSIDFQETDSLVEAVILEANLIKKHMPWYNTKEKDNKSFYFVAFTKEDFPRLILLRGRLLELNKIEKNKYKAIFGPFPEAGILKELLKIIRHIFPFRDEKMKNPIHERFYQQLGLAPETDGLEAKIKYAETIKYLIMLFEGNKKGLIKILENKMLLSAKTEKFEEANRYKRAVAGLQHIQDISLIKQFNPETNLEVTLDRIEAYDIAHTAGKEVVGVMTVIENGLINKKEYRKFKLKVDENNDVKNIGEILIRRFNHPEWQSPNLIVIDGGKPQINFANEILKSLNINIPIVSLVKDEKHRPSHILGDTEMSSNHRKAIILANSEAHRFAIKYHRTLRRDSFMI